MNILSTLCLLAGAQGLLLFYHFSKREKGEPVLNRLVAVMVIVYSINLINTYAYLEGLSVLHQILQPIGNYLGWLIGPSILFYVRYPNHPSNWRKTIAIHYGPVLPIAILGSSFPLLYPYLGFLYYIQFVSYLSVAIYLIFKGKINRDLLSWISPFIYAMALIKLANIIAFGLEFAKVITVPDSLQISFIILAAFPIFFIAYREMNADRTFMPEPTKYGNSGVKESEIDSLFNHIRSVIEIEKLFLNPDLKIVDVAILTNTSKRKVSQVVNQSRGQNFSSFINQYRLKEAAHKLANPSLSHLSILGIAEESGFNSGGRFNTLFKDKFGCTPSEYRDKHLLGS